MSEPELTKIEKEISQKGTAVATVVATLERLEVNPDDIGVIALIVQNSLVRNFPDDVKAIVSIANMIQTYGTLKITTDLTIDEEKMKKDAEDRESNGDNVQEQDVRSEED